MGLFIVTHAAVKAIYMLSKDRDTGQGEIPFYQKKRLCPSFIVIVPMTRLPTIQRPILQYQGCLMKRWRRSDSRVPFPQPARETRKLWAVL
ncbi:hypothetical protein BJX66DRAFT_318652, partial [Aspergillus keveii]